MEQKFVLIKEECLNSVTTDPIELIIHIMQKEYISIHGPEHHVLDGACFLTAMHNTGVEFDLDTALDEMIERGKKMPGATCGQWGVCGSASSIGAALAILHGTGPLSNNQYYKDNLNFVSKALGNIAEVGGPRCCKRNAFLSLHTAIDFVREQYGIELPKHKLTCCFSHQNKQCMASACPFWKKDKLKVAFVCVHNSCRSQIAEALGKHLASEVFESYSAGTETKPQINQDAVRMMKRIYGINMEQTQHSKLLSEIPQVDVVITMGCNVQCPTLPCKFREDWGLLDPTGKSDEEFLKVIHAIENKIQNLKEKLQEGL